MEKIHLPKISTIDITYSGNPCCSLLIQVLDRALRDLEDPDKMIRKEAAQWFCTWENALPYAISFKDIRDHIPLSACRLRHIERKIISAGRITNTCLG